MVQSASLRPPDAGDSQSRAIPSLTATAPAATVVGVRLHHVHLGCLTSVLCYACIVPLLSGILDDLIRRQSLNKLTLTVICMSTRTAAHQS